MIATLGTEEETYNGGLLIQQWEDKDVGAIIKYLEMGILPQDEGQAQTLVLSSSQYVLEDNVLYKVEPDSTLQVISPKTHGKSSSIVHTLACIGLT